MPQTSRRQQADELIDFYVTARPDESELAEKVYQAMLREFRPTKDEQDFIDARIQRGLAAARGSTPAAPPSSIYRDGIPLILIIDELRTASPLARLYPLINKINNWEVDMRETRRAYIFACFSELAYLHLHRSETPERARYKIYKLRVGSNHSPGPAP